MICIAIAQESRRFALVDMLNAAPQCDLIELRLDKFENPPDTKEFIAHKRRPVIFSCQRPQDGGHWRGSEIERLALLRQCILNKADFVEIELDAADQVRPLPPTKRIVSYTNLQETPPNIAEIYQQLVNKKPDIIKLTTVVRDAVDALPLIGLLVRATIPTVVVGRGQGGVMLSLMAKKLRSPWTYAALEKGMETYPAQPTIHALETVYHYRAIQRETRLIGVVAGDHRAGASIAVLNAGLARVQQSIRCAPLLVGDLAEFRTVTTALKKIDGVVVDERNWESYAEVATGEAGASRPRLTDLLLRKDGEWHGYSTLARAAASALENSLRERSTNPHEPFHGRMVMIVGTNATANMMAAALHERKAIMMIASHEKEAALAMAKQYDCRYVPFDSLYSTSHDVLVVCAEERLPFKKESADQPAGIHPGYLKPSITVMDLTSLSQPSALAKAAAVHGSPVVTPETVRLEQMALQVETLGGQPAPREVMNEVWKTLLEDDGTVES